MSGYVRIHRALIGHPAFRNDAEAMAFAWMVAKAAWKPTKARYKGHDITLQRGQLTISIRDFADAMDRPKGWVERLFVRLREHGMIEQKNGTEVGTKVGTHGGTGHGTPANVITICNYTSFQADCDGRETPKETPRKTAAGQRQDTEQIREEKKKEEIDLPDWLPESYFEFRAMRLSMRNVPFGPSAERRVIAKLSRLRGEGHDPDKLLSKAIERGHRSVFEDETTKAAPSKKKLSPAEQIENLKRSIEFYSRMGRDDDVRDCRRRIAALEGPGSSPVADIIQQAANAVSIGRAA